MANVDAPFGMRPVRHRNGAAYNGAANPYYIPSTYATALFVGDPVVKTGTSNTTEYKGNGIGALPEINKATAGDANAITGVIVAFDADQDDLSKQYNPASNERLAWVCDDPDVVFHIQESSPGTPLAATSVGLNAVLIYTHSGSTVNGFSGAELDTSSDPPAADASNQLTIQRLADLPGNDIDATLGLAVWEVKINNHTEAHGVIGI